MKDYEELTFTDDFMFCKILTKHPDLCKKLIEIILNVKIRKIDVVIKQLPIELTYDGRGIRLDVYVEDDEGTVYDIDYSDFFRIPIILPKYRVMAYV